MDKYNKDKIEKDGAETEKFHENYIEGRNAVLEAYRSGKTIDKLFVLDGCQDGPVKSITREARKHDSIINYVSKERLDQLSETGKHQGVIAVSAAYSYAEVEDILQIARDKGEAPFVFILDGIEDPHNLGAIIRTANLAGAHGVIIPKRRAVGLTPTVAKTSAGAINYTPVAKVTNISNTIKELKDQGMWFVCADMGGTEMYDLNLTGSIGLVIGNEGDGVSKLVKENCDMVASIPMKGDIDSLNASVAAGVLAYEDNELEGYEKYTDEQLIQQFRDGDDAVMDYILNKYKPLVRKECNTLYLIGAEDDDLIQEGMIGLFKAVRDYKSSESHFYHFARLCIDRQLYSAIDKAKRKKHQPLNEYVSFSIEENENGGVLEDFLGHEAMSPEQMMIEQEKLEEFKKRLQKNLSGMENEVLNYYLEGNNYTQIADIMGKSPKAIDNALQRIRQKIKRK